MSGTQTFLHFQIDNVHGDVIIHVSKPLYYMSIITYIFLINVNILFIKEIKMEEIHKSVVTRFLISFYHIDSCRKQ